MNPLAALYAFWLSTPPAIREPIRSVIVSYSLSLWPVFAGVVGVGLSDGLCNTPEQTLRFVSAHWWVAFLSAMVAPALALRARQASTKVANTVSLMGGAEAVITKPGNIGA